MTHHCAMVNEWWEKGKNGYSFLVHINTVRRPFVQTPLVYFADTLVEGVVIKWRIESWLHFD